MTKALTSDASLADTPMQVIGGKIALLTEAEERVNLLAGIQKKATQGGVRLALGGRAYAAAKALPVERCDGEAVFGCGFALEDQVVIGTFENAFFEEGDDVKVVVGRVEHGLMFAHAVVRVSDGTLWMPDGVKRGRIAMMKFIGKMAAAGALSAGVLVLAMAFAQGGMRETIQILLPGVVGMATFIGFVSYRDIRDTALYAEKIFKVLGFKNPKIVNLSPFSLTKESGYRMGRSHYIFRLRKALAAYGSLSKAPASPVKAEPPTTATPAPKTARPATRK